MSIVMNNNLSNFSDSNNSFIYGSKEFNVIGNLKEHSLNYEISENGEKKYLSDETIAIILLESSRGLKWKSSEEGEVILNCPAGMVFIIPAHTTCQITWPKSTAHLLIVLDDSFFSNGEGEGSQPSMVPVHFTNKQCLQLAQILWTEIQVSSHVSHAYIDAFRMALTGVLLRNASVATGGGRQQFGLSNYACRQIEQHLKENFRQPVSVPDMAALIGISAGHFATCFRASFGLTPHQYLMRLRLDEAERCLRETDISLNELAASLGFSSQSHMTTALRKYRHITPGEIRRRSYAQRRSRVS